MNSFSSSFNYIQYFSLFSAQEGSKGDNIKGNFKGDFKGHSKKLKREQKESKVVHIRAEEEV